ncbi:amidohydrolase [Marmoricola endophyticus]|uniref:Amidohydrolase n=1 Tax=Marmoricola endophyticus TaxID=2040280 RepID=A0A917BHY8_9ACTN|nr:amidohydrolase [Marmoricola endophyticus]GGF40758.1 amidohydrolase [Marmoricola endophyticus]
MPDPTLAASVRQSVDALAPELVELRRDLHAHPELAWTEVRTTSLVAGRLAAAGVRTVPLEPTGLLAEVGPASGPVVVLRADLDALPVDDLTTDPWRSAAAGTAHACGHDVHTVGLLGAVLALASVAERLPVRVRAVFQPAEEVMPGGSHRAIEQGALADAAAIFTVHCDPGVDVGSIGLREGPITGAADALEVRLSGTGGHTSRPHLTQDLTFALAKLLTEVPAVLSRRFDPRSGVSVVWGAVSAGSAMNVIPAAGRALGTVRTLDPVAWADAEAVVREVVAAVLAPYGVRSEVGYVRGVPPVVNDPAATAVIHRAAAELLGEEAVQGTPQSTGGEDFAWYLEHIPGAMARLGTRTPGGPTYDLHQGDLRVDERAVATASALLASIALTAMDDPEIAGNITGR